MSVLHALEMAAAVTRREQALTVGEGGDLAQLPDKMGAIQAAARVFDGLGVVYALGAS